MSEPVDSESKSASLLEKIPILDGSVRRRFIAGTVVTLTLLGSYPSIQTALSTLSTDAGVSSALFLVAAGLIIYALGAMVELLGELFFARAVAGFTSAFVRERPESRLQAVRRIFLTVPIGPFRFIRGLLGKTDWKLWLTRYLSEDGRLALQRLPTVVAAAIDQPLGMRSEFGQKAITDLFEDRETRRWAKMTLARPKEVLAVVSGVVVSSVMLFAAPALAPAWIVSQASDYEKATQETLAEHVAIFDKAQNSAEATLAGAELTDERFNRVTSYLEQLRKEAADFKAYITIHGQTPPSFTSHVMILLFNQYTPPLGLSTGSYAFNMDMDLRACKKAPEPSEVNLIERARICKRLSFARTMFNTLREASNNMHQHERRQIQLRFLLFIASLSLYAAFFHSIRSATVNVVEALAIARPDPARAV